MPRQKSGSTPEDSDDDDVMKEWQATRDVLAQFDGYLHDIRKYGFSFVTGLLTVDALLGGAPTEYKLAALIGTMALIVVLFVLDRNYRVFNEAANLRATLLERRSPPELSQTITRVYETQRVGFAFTCVYFGLECVTFVVGVLVLQSAALSWYLSLALVVAIISMLLMHFTLEIRPWVYLDIDGYAYEKPESVMVVVTHLRGKHNLRSFFPRGGPPPLKLNAHERVWNVYREDDPSMEEPQQLWTQDAKEDPRAPKEDILIDEHYDHRWEFPTSSLEAGLYRVVYEGPWYRGKRLMYKLYPGVYDKAREQLKADQREEDRRNRWDDASRFQVLGGDAVRNAEEKKGPSEPSYDR